MFNGPSSEPHRTREAVDSPVEDVWASFAPLEGVDQRNSAGRNILLNREALHGPERFNVSPGAAEASSPWTIRSQRFDAVAAHPMSEMSRAKIANDKLHRIFPARNQEISPKHSEAARTLRKRFDDLVASTEKEYTPTSSPSRPSSMSHSSARPKQFEDYGPSTARPSTADDSLHSSLLRRPSQANTWRASTSNFSPSSHIAKQVMSFGKKASSSAPSSGKGQDPLPEKATANHVPLSPQHSFESFFGRSQPELSVSSPAPESSTGREPPSASGSGSSRDRTIRMAIPWVLLNDYKTLVVEDLKPGKRLKSGTVEVGLPSKPASRKDAVVLDEWLRREVQRLSKLQESGRGGQDENAELRESNSTVVNDTRSSAVDDPFAEIDPALNNDGSSLLQKCQEAMVEMVRQVGVHCIERGECLASLWTVVSGEIDRVAQGRRAGELRLQHRNDKLKRRLDETHLALQMTVTKYKKLKEERNTRVSVLQDKIVGMNNELFKAETYVKKRCMALKWNNAKGCALGYAKTLRDMSPGLSRIMVSEIDIIERCREFEKLLSGCAVIYQERQRKRDTDNNKQITNMLKTATSAVQREKSRISSLFSSMGLDAEQFASIDLSDPVEALRGMSGPDAGKLLDRLQPANTARVLAKMAPHNAQTYLMCMSPSMRAQALTHMKKDVLDGIVRPLSAADVSKLLAGMDGEQMAKFLLKLNERELVISMLRGVTSDIVAEVLGGLVAHKDGMPLASPCFKAFFDANYDQAAAVIANMQPVHVAPILSELPLNLTALVLCGESCTAKHTAACLTALSSSDAATILKRIRTDVLRPIVEEMDTDPIVRLMSYLSNYDQQYILRLLVEQRQKAVFDRMEMSQQLGVLTAMADNVETKEPVLMDFSDEEEDEMEEEEIFIQSEKEPETPARKNMWTRARSVFAAPANNLLNTVKMTLQLSAEERMKEEYRRREAEEVHVKIMAGSLENVQPHIAAKVLVTISLAKQARIMQDVERSHAAVIFQMMEVAQQNELLAGLLTYNTSALSGILLAMEQTRAAMIIKNSLHMIMTPDLVKLLLAIPPEMSRLIVGGMLKENRNTLMSAIRAENSLAYKRIKKIHNDDDSMSSESGGSDEEDPEVDISKDRNRFSPKDPRVQEALRLYGKARPRNKPWILQFMNKYYALKREADMAAIEARRDIVSLPEFLWQDLLKSNDSDDAVKAVMGEVCSTLLTCIRHGPDPRITTFSKFISEAWDTRVLSQYLEAYSMLEKSSEELGVMAVEYAVEKNPLSEPDVCLNKCFAVSDNILGKRSLTASRMTMDRLTMNAVPAGDTQLSTYMETYGERPLERLMRIPRSTFLEELCTEADRCELFYQDCLADLFKEFDADKSGTFELDEVEQMVRYFVEEVEDEDPSVAEMNLDSEAIATTVFQSALKADLLSGNSPPLTEEGEDTVSVYGWKAAANEPSADIIRRFVMISRLTPPPALPNKEEAKKKDRIIQVMAHRHWRIMEKNIDECASQAGTMESMIRGYITRMKNETEGVGRLRLYLLILKTLCDQPQTWIAEKLKNTESGSSTSDDDIVALQRLLMQFEDSLTVLYSGADVVHQRRMPSWYTRFTSKDVQESALRSRLARVPIFRRHHEHADCLGLSRQAVIMVETSTALLIQRKYRALRAGRRINKVFSAKKASKKIPRNIQRRGSVTR
ncbi:hypothetical protein CYMTET_52366 [Cymbomonas tetramitiformis]|uniref:EF-hand domain-containing protein n=1 Tax=Cymbomonas tetramitiformis TaxID=36881 RepID=A0AAE0BKB5_9CHLO|nr:hypothetical protein CYMTET_52366 [Cymbomonas tetramitiformis]